MGTLFDSDRFPPISRSQQGAGDSGKGQARGSVWAFLSFGDDGSIALVLVGRRSGEEA